MQNKTFTPGKTNKENYDHEELQDYFNRVEPEFKLKVSAEENPLYEFKDEGKAYHFRYTPEEFQKKFGKEDIHNDWDELFRFKNGDYGIHIAPPAPKPNDDPTPVGAGEFRELPSHTQASLLDKLAAKEDLKYRLEDYYARREEQDRYSKAFGGQDFKGSEPSKNVEDRTDQDLSFLNPLNEYYAKRGDPGYRSPELQASYDKFWERAKKANEELSTDPMAIEAGINKIGREERVALPKARPKVKAKIPTS